MGKKVKLMIEIGEEEYEIIKTLIENTVIQNLTVSREFLEAIANGTPYNPSGDLISREWLKKQVVVIRSVGGGELRYISEQTIDNAPTVPQINVFCENADEKAVEDLKSELQSVIGARPNEQTAWEQGYEAGLAQGKHDRQEGEWIEYNATGKKQYMCSKCSMEEKNPKIARYCYWCGAKMKGGAE